MPAVHRRRQLLSALGALCCTPWAAAQSGGSRPLVFGLITPRASEQMLENWRPFTDRMATALRQPVEPRAFTDSADLVTAFRGGQIDFAWLGNAPALDVVESGTGAVFAQMVTKEGSHGYHSVLVVPADSKLRTLGEVLAAGRTLRFADGDLKSTSGHLVPYYFAFQKNGINDTTALFKSVTHGSHQKNMTQVAEGAVDVATANTEEMQFFAHDFPALAAKLRVVWESPLIPQSPLLWRTTLPADVRKRALEFVTAFGAKDPAQKKILEKLNNLSGFRQSNNRQLVPVADIEMFKARQAINNDTGLAPEQRAKRIDEAIRRGSRLDLLLKITAGF